MLGKKAEEMYQFPSVGAHQLQRLESTCEVEKVNETCCGWGRHIL